MAASVEPDARPSARPAGTRAMVLGVVVAIALLMAPFLLHCLARVPKATPIDYNEGWNAYHTARLIAGGPLYLPVDGLPVAPVNYPPLSFLIFGALARGTGNVLLTGRLLSLASLLCVSILIFRIVGTVTASRPAAVLAALYWVGLVARLAPAELGSYDEQMLGHVFDCCALYLYSRWRGDLAARQIRILALLCCLGLFVKQLLVAVPLAIATATLLESRRRFFTFVSASVVILAIFAAATRLLGGPYVLANLFAFDRQMDAAQRMTDLRAMFVERGAIVLLLPAAALLARSRKDATALLSYFAVSLALGGYAIGGVGVDRNAWLDFFIASSLALGALAGTAQTLRRSLQRGLTSLIVMAAITPIAAGARADLPRSLDYESLAREEEAYRADVELLRGVAGPALFEEPLLGFDAAKEFLFDPFSGSQMILSGRLPESILTDRIRRGEFAVIVLTSRDVEELRKRLQRTGRPASAGPPRRLGWWTRGTLEAVRDNYVLHAPDRRRYAFFYFPVQP